MPLIKKKADQIYEALKQEILSQNIKFGEKLTGRGLQERFGVSSSPVRDAINRLYLEGFLDEISNSGARVIPFDYKRAIEINEVISMLNREALILSAIQASNVTSRLEEILNQQKIHISDDVYFALDRQFHQTFFDFCGNSRLSQLYSEHSALWSLLLEFVNADKETHREKFVSQHQVIYDFYSKGNISEAQHHMGEHFSEVVRPLTHILESDSH
jgi:DNA-binding GntR family transcriptional regulator